MQPGGRANRRARQFDPTPSRYFWGKVNPFQTTATTLAGQSRPALGGNDGDRIHARFHGPSGIAPGIDGGWVVVDRNNHAIRRVDGATGMVSTLAGGAGRGYSDGVGAEARFNFPCGVALCPGGGAWLVADYNNHRIRRVAADGTVTTVAGSGAAAAGDGDVDVAASPAATFAAVARVIRSRRGTHQGCVLATLGAVLPMHLVLCAVAKACPHTRIACMADDTYLGGSPSRLYQDFQYMRGELERAAGLADTRDVVRERQPVEDKADRVEGEIGEEDAAVVQRQRREELLQGRGELLQCDREFLHRSEQRLTQERRTRAPCTMGG